MDERFFLNATGEDYAQLRTRGVRDALLRLSDSIREIAILEEGAGLELTTEVTATSESIASDLEVAIANLISLFTSVRGERACKASGAETAVPGDDRRRLEGADCRRVLAQWREREES